MARDNSPVSSGAENDVETSRQILKAISDSIQSSIYLFAPDYTIIFFNKNAFEGTKLFYGREPFIGDNILNYRFKGDDDMHITFKANFEKALSTKTAVVSEREMHFPMMTCWVRAEFTPVYDRNKVLGVLHHVQNISDLKKYASQSERQTQLLEHIAWIQSHQTRQPLASLLGLIHILEKESLTPENRKVIDMIQETALKLEQVIQQTVIKANLENENLKDEQGATGTNVSS